MFATHGVPKPQKMAATRTIAGHPVFSPAVVLSGARAFIGFAEQAFGFKVHGDIYPTQDGAVAYAEIMIQGCMLVVFDPQPDYPPQNAKLFIYVPDLDATFKRVLELGATEQAPPQVHGHYGIAVARVLDPWNNLWTIAQAI